MNFARLQRRAIIMLLGGAATLVAGSMLAAGAALAQTYPSRPITLVVPFPPGGATDAIARIIQDSMGQSLGQQIVIENIGGAGGMIAAGRAARAAPDGYTVLLHQVALAAGMTLYPNLGFDAEKDFVSIGLINTAASTLAGRSTLPPSNIAELVRWMKEPGQNPKIAHPGVGSFGHLAGVLVAEEIGATVTQVPYRGAGPALNDLLSRPARSRAMLSSAERASPGCRTCRPWARSATRSSISISGTCCWRRAARRARSSSG
jgi:tripartite-type tricarboxylate transporter receptor subunit TctC